MQILPPNRDFRSGSFVGYVGAVAVNGPLRGSLDNFTPPIAVFKELQKNQPIAPKQTAYARSLSGEIPILFGYDVNAYRAKQSDDRHLGRARP
jgi:putative spermidine/putrescine transport system substrate-binding protein